MLLSDIIDSNAVVSQVEAVSKKQLLSELAEVAAKLTKLDPRQIFESLMQREKLGSTGLGRGIAIPHGKFNQLDRVHGFFARLAKPVDFDAIDGEPVDLVFLLLAPENAGADHLKALARISRLLRDSNVVRKLRGTDEVRDLYSVLTGPAATSNAA